MYGWCSTDDTSIRTTYMKDPDWSLSDYDVLVGHNIMFDMLYLLRDHKEETIEWIRNGGKIYDTMTAEYLLTNLMHKFPSLDETCVKYGGTTKNDIIKAYWNAGIRTEDIPRHELTEYLEYDVKNTYTTYGGQVALANEFGMSDMFDCHFSAMLALLQMTTNGMKFDVGFAREEAARIETELVQLREEAVDYMSQFFVKEFEIKPTSTQQLSVVLFGGPYKYRRRGPILDKLTGVPVCKKERRLAPKLDEQGFPVYYKTGPRAGQNKMVYEYYDGEIKTKWYDHVSICKGLGLTPNPRWALKDKRFFSVGEGNLKVLMNQTKDKSVSDFLSKMIRIATLSKDLSTYFKGYSALTWPGTGLIHPNFNTSLTATGRLSSSKPNMQNQSAKKGSTIKQCFISRWGDKGRIVEIDLSQIEVVTQAFLSQDSNMMQDIVNGVDFHCKRLAFAWNQDYDHVWRMVHQEKDANYVKGRKNIKVFSFQNALT